MDLGVVDLTEVAKQLDELVTDLEQDIGDSVTEITKLISDIQSSLEYHADIEIPVVREHIKVMLGALNKLDEEHERLLKSFGKLWNESTRLLP